MVGVSENRAQWELLYWRISYELFHTSIQWPLFLFLYRTGAARLSYANTPLHLCITISAHDGIFDEEREIEKTVRIFNHNAVVKYAPSSYNSRDAIELRYAKSCWHKNLISKSRHIIGTRAFVNETIMSRHCLASHPRSPAPRFSQLMSDVC